MRWFFVLLVLANGFYALWHLQMQSPEPVGGDASSSGRAPTLVLVSEADPALLERSEAEPLHVEAAPVEIAPACWFVAIFDDKQQADRAVAAVQAAQLQARIETLDVADRSDYWVHVGPYASRQKAMAVLQQLRADGIDSFLIGEGELENGISLGFFSQKVSAERLARRHRNIGHPVSIFEVKRVRPSYHLYVFGRVEEPELEALMKDQGLAANPAKKPKKSCI